MRTDSKAPGGNASKERNGPAEPDNPRRLSSTVIGDVIVCDKCLIQWVPDEGCECTKVVWRSVLTGIMYPRKDLCDEAIAVSMPMGEYNERWGDDR